MSFSSSPVFAVLAFSIVLGCRSIEHFCADAAFVDHSRLLPKSSGLLVDKLNDADMFAASPKQSSFSMRPRNLNTLPRAMALYMARPKKGGKGSPALKNGKVQVKMTKFVEGTGRVGDIVLVAPAFWENKLKKTSSAVLISDEEVEADNALKSQSEAEALATAKDVGAKVSNTVLEIKKKAGPNGHIFGGVGKKTVVDMLKMQLPLGCLDSKAVKIKSIKEEESGKELKHDVKEIGTYDVRICLHKDVGVDFKMKVAAEP